MKRTISTAIKRCIFAIEERFPSLGAGIIFMLRKVRFMYFRLFFFKNKLRHGDIDQNKVIWVDPNTITHIATVDLLVDRGRVVDGDWDLHGKLFHEGDIYTGMVERYIDESPWEETEHFKKFSASIKSGKPRWGCRTVEEFKVYLGKLDELFADIRDDGYKRVQDPGRVDVYQGKNDKDYEQLDEVAVSIDRGGGLLFADGAHRLAMAQILKLSQIPVVVIRRHAQWFDFRKEVAAFAHASQGHKLYQQAFHPDLADIPHALADERWPAIATSLQTKSGRALDIGTNFGLMCYKLEKEFGLDCVGVEINPQEVYLAQKIRDSVGASFAIELVSVFDLDSETVSSFDVVLALNIFHHFIKRKVEYDRLVSFLEKLQCQEMFFEAHGSDEWQMEDAYQNFSPDEFVEFICQHSVLNTYEHIYTAESGRRMYRISQ